MRRLGSVLFAFMAVCIMLAPVTGAPSGEPIKVGVVMSMTGVMAGGGVYAMNALNMRRDEINAAGGVLGRPLSFVLVDDQSDQTAAINAMNKVVSDKDIVAVIGPHTSTNATAVSNTVKKAGIPYFTGGTSVKLLSLDNKYLLRARCSDAIVANVAVKFMVETLKVKKLGILYINDEFGTGGRDVMLNYLKGKDVKIVTANHNATDQDLTGQILQLKQQGIDGMIAWSSNLCALVVKQCYELGFDKPLMVNSAFVAQYVLDTMETKEVEGVYSATDMSPEDTDPIVASFVAKFGKLYNGQKPEAWASCYYGALTVLADSIKRAGTTDRESVLKAIYQTKDLPGILCDYTSNSKGELVNQCVVVQVKNKSFKLVKKVVVDNH